MPAALSIDLMTGVADARPPPDNETFAGGRRMTLGIQGSILKKKTVIASKARRPNSGGFKSEIP